MNRTNELILNNPTLWIYTTNQCGSWPHRPAYCSTKMITFRSKKWWWPLFRFVLDVSVNNTFQQYHMRNLDQGGKRLDALGFRREIVDACFRKFCKSATIITLHPCNRLLHNPAENFWYYNCKHWIVKGVQKRCALYGCKGTSKHFREKCSVGLHPDCFKTCHIP